MSQDSSKNSLEARGEVLTYSLGQVVSFTGKHRNTILYHRKMNNLKYGEDYIFDPVLNELRYFQRTIEFLKGAE